MPPDGLLGLKGPLIDPQVPVLDPDSPSWCPDFALKKGLEMHVYAHGPPGLCKGLAHLVTENEVEGFTKAKCGLPNSTVHPTESKAGQAYEALNSRLGPN